MATKTIINIKADKEVKEQAQLIAAKLGLPLSTIVNSFLKQFIRNEEVTFSTAYTLTPELKKVLKMSQEDEKYGRNVTKEFTVDEAITYLDTL